jgi:hypothetical protein
MLLCMLFYTISRWRLGVLVLGPEGVRARARAPRGLEVLIPIYETYIQTFTDRCKACSRCGAECGCCQSLEPAFGY